MPVPLSPEEVVLACCAVAAGSFIQGVVGFGMALMAAPVLVLLDPGLVPGPIIVAGTALTTTIAYRERQGIDLAGVRYGLPGLVLGSAAGAALLVSAPVDRLPLVLGGLVLFAVTLSLAGLRVEPRPRNVGLTTILAGFMSTTASIPGPPLALLYQHAAGPRLRGTLAPLLLASNLVSLATLYAADRFGAAELRLGMVLAPAALTGLLLSRWGIAWLPPAWLRGAVLAVSGLSGLAAVLRGIQPG